MDIKIQWDCLGTQNFGLTVPLGKEISRRVIPLISDSLVHLMLNTGSNTLFDSKFVKRTMSLVSARALTMDNVSYQ